MAVINTGLTGGAVVPCSHCNSQDNGPEPGICHRGTISFGTACSKCAEAYYEGENISFMRALGIMASGQLQQVQCSFCEGNGYKRI